MKQQFDLDWSLLPSFLAVARTGSLSAAATMSRKSVPSLSRHMTTLENQLGERLFLRGDHGFELTRRGRELVARVEQINDLVEGLESSKETHAQFVKISAGSLTSQALVHHFAKTWAGNEIWMPSLIASGAMQDIARREIDIGVRNVAPESHWLASKKCGEIRYAIYKRKDTDPKGFVGIDQPASKMALWIENHCEVTFRVSDNFLGLPLLKAGAARMVLPIFAVCDDHELEACEVIDGLTTSQWLVAHQDRRHEMHIREAISSVEKCLMNIAKY